MDKYFTKCLNNKLSDPESISTPSSMPTIEEEEDNNANTINEATTNLNVKISDQPKMDTFDESISPSLNILSESPKLKVLLHFQFKNI